jgi:hypothetical protein
VYLTFVMDIKRNGRSLRSSGCRTILRQWNATGQDTARRRKSLAHGSALQPERTWSPIALALAEDMKSVGGDRASTSLL